VPRQALTPYLRLSSDPSRTLSDFRALPYSRLHAHRHVLELQVLLGVRFQDPLPPIPSPRSPRLLRAQILPAARPHLPTTPCSIAPMSRDRLPRRREAAARGLHAPETPNPRPPLGGPGWFDLRANGGPNRTPFQPLEALVRDARFRRAKRKSAARSPRRLQLVQTSIHRSWVGSRPWLRFRWPSDAGKMGRASGCGSCARGSPAW
jgi:hypothetical protein